MLSLTLDLTWPQRGEKERGHLHDFSQQVFPLLDSNLAQSPWRIRLSSRRFLSIEPSALYYWDDHRPGQMLPSKQLLLTAHAPMKAVTAHCDPSLGEVHVVPLSEQPDKFRLTVTPRASIPPGPFTFRVTISAVRNSGEHFPDRFLIVQGAILRPFEIAPPVLAFGARLLGERGTQTVLVRSPVADPVTIESFHCGSDDVIVEQLDKPTVEGKAFRVTQLISQAGLQCRNVSFALRGKANDRIIVPLEISYYGVQK